MAVCAGAVVGWPPGPPSSRLLCWRHHGGGARGDLVLAEAPWWCLLSADCFVEVAGASSSLGHERAAGVVESGVSLHRSMDMMAAPLGRQNLCWGHHGEPLCYRCLASQGEYLIHLDVRRQGLGVVTFLEALHLGVPMLVWSWRSSGGVAGSMLGPCCCQGAEGSWVLEVLSCHACCSGDLGDGWVEEMLSVRS
jgi:hypothetical protein